MRTVVWWALALAAASGCGTRAPEPQPVRLDKDHCAYCDMIISSDANAGQAVSAGEDARFYDDLGCMARDRAARASGARLFVHAAEGSDWIPAEAAWFARSGRLRTPMGHGIGAFATEAAARAAADDGRALRWADVTAQEADAR